MGAVKTLTELVVEITRDPMMKPSATIYAHELPLMIALHGEDAVQVKEEYEVHLPEGFTPEDEWERLRLKWERRRKKGQSSILLDSYPGGARSLAQVLGIALTGKLNKKYETESIQKSRDSRRVDGLGSVDNTQPIQVDVNPDGTLKVVANPVDKTATVRVKGLAVAPSTDTSPAAEVDTTNSDAIVDKVERLTTGKKPVAKAKAKTAVKGKAKAAKKA